MNKINKEIFDLFSEPKMFEAAVNVLESWQIFKENLILNFVNALTTALQLKINLKEWGVSSNTDYSDKTYFEIYIQHVKDKDRGLAFTIINGGDNQMFGIYFDKESKSVKKSETLFKEAEELKAKDKDWKIGNYKDMSWPVYFRNRDLNFKDNNSLKKIIPTNLNSTIADNVETLELSFTIEIQEFIKSHL